MKKRKNYNLIQLYKEAYQKSLDEVKALYAAVHAMQGLQLGQLREKLNVTITRIASEMHVGQSVVRRFENGEPVYHPHLIMEKYISVLRKIHIERTKLVDERIGLWGDDAEDQKKVVQNSGGYEDVDV